ncbi:MAG TPA: hypothetical protein HPQ00_05730, partial [Magnetococcales bacterium]|nr:hypothetical protein [Magnetococcales bacterium]
MALDLFLMLFDGDCDADLRREAAGELNSLLADATTRVGLEGVMYALPMPESADLVAARNVCNDHVPHVQEFLKLLLNAQGLVRSARAAWDKTCEQHFDSSEGRSRALALAHEHAFFPRVVRAMANDGLWQGTLFDLHKRLPSLRGLINQWTHSLKPAAVAPITRPMPDMGSGEGRKRPSKHPQNLASTANPLKHVEQLKDDFKRVIALRDFTEAENVLDQLLRFHEEGGHSGKRKKSGRAFAAKSLCDLAMFCKKQGLYDWQLRLAEMAVGYNSEDPQTWSHKGGALAENNKLEEALKVFDDAFLKFPGDVVAKTGRAEVLKSLNRLEDS